ncbi:MAG TPA: phage tail protein [Kofleriaceae bacterium]|nr:phage tail protein [Kofleriaceae bacterium]
MAARNDPLPVFCFQVTFTDLSPAPSDAFFKSVGGLRYETEVIPVRAGGANDTTYQLVGATKWSNLVLKQGFTGDGKLLAWRETWLSGTTMKRSGGTITQLDTAFQPRAQWQWFGGWPCKWEIGEFDASKSEVAIETLELAINRLVFIPKPVPAVK